jgi:hypothetical protein
MNEEAVDTHIDVETPDNDDDEPDVESEAVPSCRSRLVSAQLLDMKVSTAESAENDLYDVEKIDDLLPPVSLLATSGSDSYDNYDKVIKGELVSMDETIDALRKWRVNNAKQMEHMYENDDVGNADNTATVYPEEPDELDTFVGGVCQAVPESVLDQLMESLSEGLDATVINSEAGDERRFHKYWTAEQFKGIQQQLLQSDEAISALRNAMTKSSASSSSSSRRERIDGSCNRVGAEDDSITRKLYLEALEPQQVTLDTQFFISIVQI